MLTLTARDIPAQETPGESEEPEAASAAVELTGPVLVTALGAADGGIVRTICRQAGLEPRLADAPEAEDLEDLGTLVVAMGSANANRETEDADSEPTLERERALLTDAADAGAKILGIHVGGASRRGRRSDPLCSLVAQSADVLIVKAGGNGDGLFTSIAEEGAIPLIEVKTNAEAVEAVEELFED
jgi:hypothetical protein